MAGVVGQHPKWLIEGRLLMPQVVSTFICVNAQSQTCNFDASTHVITHTHYHMTDLRDISVNDFEGSLDALGNLVRLEELCVAVPSVHHSYLYT